MVVVLSWWSIVANSKRTRQATGIITLIGEDGVRFDTICNQHGLEGISNLQK